MALEENIEERTKQIIGLIKLWAITHPFCKRLLEDLEEESEEERARFWRNIATNTHTVEDLKETVSQLEQPDPYEMYRGY